MLSRLITYAWFLIAALIILAALSVSAARLLLPLMADYRDDIEAGMSARLQRQVSIEKMDAGWRGLGPTLLLKKVSIGATNDATPVFAVDEVWLHVDLWSSLFTGKLKAGDVSLVGLSLNVIRDQDGHVALQGFERSAAGDSGGGKGLLSVLGSGDIALLDTVLHWEDQTRETPSVTLTDVQVTLAAEGKRLRVNAAAQLPPDYGQHLTAVVSVEDLEHDIDTWRGNAFLQVGEADLQGWLALLPAPALAVDGQLDLKFWATFADQKVDRLALEVEAEHLSLAADDAAATEPFELDILEGRMLWERYPDGWGIKGDRFTVAHAGFVWPESRFRYEQHQSDVLAVSGAADHVDLTLLSRLFAALPEKLRHRSQPLQVLSPVGVVSGLQFATELEGNRPRALSLSAQFTDLGMSAWEKIPGFSGLTGTISGDLRGGELVLDSAAGELDAAHLFRAPLPLDKLAGIVRWEHVGSRWTAHSRQMQVANEDLAATGRWRLDIPEDGQSPFLSLAFDIERADIDNTSRYLPARVMNPKAVQWLDHGLLAGKSKHGTVLFHGPTRRFPFDGNEGRFEAWVEVEQAVLDYKAGWQRIEDLHADVVFSNAGMDIAGHSGRIAATRIRDVRAWTPDLRRQGPPLLIGGRAEGGLPDMLKFLNDSPLGGGYRVLTEKFVSSGQASLDLQLTIPLRKQHAEFAVEGELGLRNNGLNSEAWGLGLARINGQLFFTQDTIGSRDLKATLWGNPVDVTLDTVDAATGGYHRVRVNGPFGLVQQVKAWQWPVADYLEGAGDWLADIHINHPRPGQGPRVDIALSSSLEGIAVALPTPLGKPAELQRPLRISRSFAGEAAGPLQVTYGDDVQSVLELRSENGRQYLERGELHFGVGAAQLPEASVLRLAGSLQRLSLADWQSVLPRGEGKDRAIPPVDMQLEIHALEFYQSLLRDVGMSVSKRGEAWSCDFTGPGADGHLQVKPGKDGLDEVAFDLKHLRIETIADTSGFDSGLELDPRNIPSLKLRTDHLEYDGEVLGAFALESQRQPDGQRIESLRLESKDYQFSAAGTWLVEADDRHVSRFRLELKEGNLGMLLERFGYERTMETQHANAVLLANWPGSPLEFSLEQVEGQLDVDFGSGQLVRVNAPAGRALSVLSVHSLQRRLALDFSDLFGKGFGFDAIKGHIAFMDGDSYTSDLTVTSPSAQISVSGRTGFVSKDYDQLVTVTPRVTSNLPLAGALAGGPAVGAALFVAERLFGGKMDKIAQYQYQLTGTWENPKMERISLGPVKLPGKTPGK